MSRAVGSKNRNYPALPLARALAIARAIEDQASGQDVSKLTLAGLVDSTPTSGTFRDLIGSSRLYGLTTGGINAETFGITDLGRAAVSDDEVRRVAALKVAVLNIEPYRIFFETYANKKLPTTAPLKEFLTTQAGFDASRVDEAIDYLNQDAETAGFYTEMKGGKWIDLSGVPAATEPDEAGQVDGEDLLNEDGDGSGDTNDLTPEPPAPAPPVLAATSESLPKAIFLGHGKNKKPLEQLIKILDEYGIPHREALAEANAGRPIPVKVAEVMRECGAAILIFSADEEFFDGDQKSIWRPSENVVHELGASSVLYDNRIIIFKEDEVNLASNFSSIGYISFEQDKLSDKGIELFRELVKFKIVKVTVG